MLVHQCIECGTLSINRIAADDDPSNIIEVFQASINNQMQVLCEGYGILLLKSYDVEILHQQLYGGMEVPISTW